MMASQQTGFSYTWTNGASPLYGNFINLSQGGTWTVTAQDNNNTSSIYTQTFFIAQNFTVPAVSIVVTPTVNNISCAGSSGCFTVTCTGNNTTNWYMKNSPSGNKTYQSVNCGTFNVLCAGNPGTYWFESVDPANGCAATQSVQVTASVGVPVFTVTSPSNFSLGCGSASAVSMQVPNVSTSPVASVSCVFAFMTPPVTSTPTSFSSTFSLTNVTTPGTYVVWVRDQTNNCLGSQSVCVTQNTTAPNAYYTSDNPMLSCKKPVAFLTGITNSPNTSINWILPINTFTNGPIVAIGTQTNYPNAQTMIIGLGIHTVVVTNTITQCIGTATYHVVQDTRIPYFTITATPNQSITCSNPTVDLNATTTQTLYVALGHIFDWQTPSPPTFTGTSYTTTTIVNTATATSQTNGCKFVSTFTAPAEYVLSITDATIGSGCPVQTVNVSPNYYNGTADLTFAWSGPGISGPTTQSSVIGTSVGVYVCVVTNTAINCAKTVSVTVDCSLGLAHFSYKENTFMPSPNPFEDMITINSQLKDVIIDRLEIVNTLGQKVFSSKQQKMNEPIQVDLPEGIYIINLQVNDQVTFFKVIKN